VSEGKITGALPESRATDHGIGHGPQIARFSLGVRFMVYRAIKAVVALAFLVGSLLYAEGYLGDVRDEGGKILYCRRPPDEVAAWRGRYVTVRAEDLRRLDQWAEHHPDRVKQRYGASCETAIHMAAEFGRPDVARILLAHGAESEARDPQGRTPLHHAARRGNLAVVRLLLDHGVNPDSRNEVGQTPLMDAVFGLATEEDLSGRLEVAEALLVFGVNPDIADRGSRRTALHLAADHQGDPGFIRLLLHHGARVDVADSQGETPLHMAVSTGSLEKVRLLLDADANPNAGPRGTPLARAAYGGHLKIARLLVERGAEVDRKGPSSPLPWKGVPLETAMLAPEDREDGALEIAALLVEHGADVDSRSTRGTTYLHGAAAEGRLEWVRFLLDRGAVIEPIDTNGATPLHQAVRHGHLEVAEILLTHGADVNLVTGDGTTSLLLAREDPEMESLLRSHGAS
jgi:ankyrin repeat protein